MKKTFFQNQFDVVQSAFDKTGASRFVSSDVIGKSLPSLMVGYKVAKKGDKELSFATFCENKGNEIVVARAKSKIGLIHAKMNLLDKKTQVAPQSQTSLKQDLLDRLHKTPQASSEVQLRIARIMAHQHHFLS